MSDAELLVRIVDLETRLETMRSAAVSAAHTAVKAIERLQEVKVIIDGAKEQYAKWPETLTPKLRAALKAYEKIEGSRS